LRPQGFIFLPRKGGGDNRTRLGRKNTLDKVERKIFADSLAAAAGIGRIGTAGYLCGKITPQRLHGRGVERNAKRGRRENKKITTGVPAM